MGSKRTFENVIKEYRKAKQFHHYHIIHKSFLTLLQFVIKEPITFCNNKKELFIVLMIVAVASYIFFHYLAKQLQINHVDEDCLPQLIPKVFPSQWMRFVFYSNILFFLLLEEIEKKREKETF